MLCDAPEITRGQNRKDSVVKNTLSERAVLMRLSISVPGENRQDPGVTAEVKSSKGLGAQAGTWIKKLYPPEALSEIKKVDNEARTFHARLTLPYDVGIGILPAALVKEHGDRMREFANRRGVLIDAFLKDPKKWVDWAVEQHNGTFDATQYPGCKPAEPMVEAATGQRYSLDPDEFRKHMRSKFAFETLPLPVPSSDHFCDTVASLLGTDTAAVDSRIAEAEIEAKREVVRRLLEPVAAMAKKLAESPKQKEDGTFAEDIVFRDSLVENIADTCRIAPALNLGADPEIDKFIAEMEELTKYAPDVLRDAKNIRSEIQAKADQIAKRLSAYKF